MKNHFKGDSRASGRLVACWSQNSVWRVLQRGSVRLQRGLVPGVRVEEL